MPMAERTAEMSFGKFLELSFYEDAVWVWVMYERKGVTRASLDLDDLG